MEVNIKTDDEKLVPIYSTKYSAGADLRANIKKDLIIKPSSSILIPTGIFLEIPNGYEAQIRPRSGLALNDNITVLNTPGTIDSDYRGEVGVILINHGKNDFVVKPKMRIAQIVFSKILQASFLLKKEILSTKRGGGGFGHTGTN